MINYINKYNNNLKNENKTLKVLKINFKKFLKVKKYN